MGEPFAEQPHAVALPRGSHLQEEMTKIFLDFQKDQFFERLYDKHWNSSLRSNCPTLDDSEGITLQSFSGVFILTMIGLIMSMIVLMLEMYLQRNEKDENNLNLTKNDLQ